MQKHCHSSPFPAPLLRSGLAVSGASTSPARPASTPSLATRTRLALAAFLLLVVGAGTTLSASEAAAAAADRCLVGTSPAAAGDAAQVRAVRETIETECPCASFDGTAGRTKGSYSKCVSTVLAQEVEATRLRSACVSTVKKLQAKSTCGLDPADGALPCVRKVTASGKVGCSIKPAGKCTASAKASSVACDGYSTCIDAADIDGDLRIAAPGDDGTCVPTSSALDEWRDGVLYLAFVDRFLDGDPSNNGSPTPMVQAVGDYRGGDWAGILQKLDEGYFNDLGVNVLWITVPVDGPDVAGLGADGFYRSGYRGTWPTTLDQVEERFGTLAELQDLVTTAHGLGIRVVLDWVMNHVHETSPVFTQHPEWFWEAEISGESCICGSPACPVDGANARRCWFSPYLPDFDYGVAEALDHSLDALVGLVLQTGVDGLRLDGVPFVATNWIPALRARVEADVESVSGSHFLLLGDTRTSDPAALGTGIGSTALDGQFDHPLRAQIVRSILLKTDTMAALDAFLDDNDTRYGPALMATLLGDEETPRAVHFAQDTPLWSDPLDDGSAFAWSNQPTQPSGSSAYQRLASAFTILFTRPGIPTIYYGDEIGLAGAGQPDNHRLMQWSGYSIGQDLLHQHVRSLASIRAGHEALRTGTRESVSADDDTLVYRMRSADDEVYVAVNRSDTPKMVTGLPSGTLVDLITGAAVTGPSPVLPARGSALLVRP